MLSPKRTKFRKAMKGRMSGRAKGGDTVDFGDFGLAATECGRITSRQIEAARGPIPPNKPPTKKPAETRMGKGKGANEDWVCVVRPGRVLYELEGVDEATAKAAFHLAHHKLPMGTKMVGRVS